MSDYQRSYNREDPRLSRQNSKHSRSPEPSRKSPLRDPRTRTSSTSSWDNSSHGQFAQQPPMQTAYQHLQPSNMYPNQSNQYPNQNYYSGYENYNNYNPYGQYNQAGQQQQQQQQYLSGAVQPGPPGEEYPQGGWAPVGAYSQTGDFNLNNSAANTSNDKNYKAEGVVEELNKQKANLIKERDTYEEKVAMLRKKLDMLVKQKDELSSKHSPGRESMKIIKENSELQTEIKNKIRDASNVIDILSGLIGDRKNVEESKSSKSEDSKSEKVNYKHYDPEIHWCRMCDVFPLSAKELLVHLHSKDHHELPQEESPWHKLPTEPKFSVYEGAPVRRLPIKGLQFFVAATAWYCRLCDSWIGDLHCASQHLMSVTHSQNYTNFVEQNPHWEIEWLKDREKALERMKRKNGSDSDGKKKRSRKRDKYSPSSILNKDKKKKKRKKRRRHSSDSSSSSSSSSSSDEEDKSDKSKSIHVAMRNKMKILAESEGKWDILGKIVEEERKRQESKKNEQIKESPKEDKLMSQWMTISEPPDKDKQLLDSLKEKLKQKHDAEKQKLAAEYEAAKREKEREEIERKQKEKAAREALEREEEEKRRGEKMSLKLKEQVKLKSRENNNANYRRRRSNSNSPDRNRHHRRSRSTSSERKPKNGRRSFDESPSTRYHKEDKDKHEDKRERERDKKPPSSSSSYKKLPFIGRMPLFKNQKGKKPDDDKIEKREIQKEDYDIPRKTRFQPGNLARAFIPEPEVVCFPKLSTYPPIAPPPPVLMTEPPEPPKISVPKPPPPPKIDKVVVEEKEKKPAVEESVQDDYSMLYEDTSNTMMYPYGNVDYNMMYQQPPNFDFMQVAQNSGDNDIPRSHTMPLQPPPLPPDDPNDDLAMLGISSDDLAVQQMF